MEDTIVSSAGNCISEDRAPSAKDLGCLMGALVDDDYGHPECIHIGRWLIRRHPQARAMWEELITPRDGGITMLDLARMMLAIETRANPPEALATLEGLVRQIPEAEKAWLEFERMADDVGNVRDWVRWPISVLDLHQKFDRLMEAEDWWDPKDVIELQFKGGIDVDELLNLANAQLAREQDEDRRRRLGDVKEKLQRYARLKRLGKQPARQQT